MAHEVRGSSRRSAVEAKEAEDSDDEIAWIRDVPTAVLCLITFTHRQVSLFL